MRSAGQLQLLSTQSIDHLLGTGTDKIQGLCWFNKQVAATIAF
jgi:hypothetical protein